MSQIIVWLVWWLWDTIKFGSSLTFMIMAMIHSSTTVSVCLRGLHVRGVFSAHGLHLCGLWFRTCCSWTPPSAFSQSRAWTTTPSRPCGWWSGLGHPHPHLYAPLRENLTTETTLPPAGQQWALYLLKACQCRCINGSFHEQMLPDVFNQQPPSSNIWLYYFRIIHILSVWFSL